LQGIIPGAHLIYPENMSENGKGIEILMNVFELGPQTPLNTNIEEYEAFLILIFQDKPTCMPQWREVLG